jgi:molybdenum cofactor synthesis domain-containing protein
MLNIGILTISDKGWSRQRSDKSGDTIRNTLSQIDGKVIEYDIVPDEIDMITTKLSEWADGESVDVIFTTGGTGFSKRDVTPEATLSVVDKIAPGFAEAMRARTFNITPMAILSRATAGIRGNCLIINLPGSPKAVHECLEIIIPAVTHAVEIIRGDVTEHKVSEI